MAEISESRASAPIVAMIGDAPHAWIMVHALRARFGDFPVLVEEAEPASVFWARRRRRLGVVTMLGQRLAPLATRLTKRGVRKRMAELLSQPGVSTAPLPESETIRVPSVNSEEAISAIETAGAQIVFLCSTRIMTKATLKRLGRPVINYHSGINPAYRGMHGGYHAMARGEVQNFGSTLHHVDASVDGGKIIATKRCKPVKGDNFHTYVTLMAVESRETVCDAVAALLRGETPVVAEADLPSRLWYGPTLWSYVWTGLTRGVW